MLGKTRGKIKSTFVQNIVTRRRALGWNQIDLAEKAELGVNTIKSIERGASQGWPSTKEAIARALGCEVDDLFVRPEHEKKASQDEINHHDQHRENNQGDGRSQEQPGDKRHFPPIPQTKVDGGTQDTKENEKFIHSLASAVAAKVITELTPNPSYTSDEIKILNLIRSLTVEGRRDVLDVIRTLTPKKKSKARPRGRSP